MDETDNVDGGLLDPDDCGRAHRASSGTECLPTGTGVYTTFTWNHDLPPGGAVSYPRSPIGFHDASQVIGTPLFEPDRFVIKFHNL